ncbi:GGDEF domain-containing response regulator [Hahella sp. CCB-MM4]|uniref:EAL domain-containing protein n=1 Tax=Hahella sp. (strain CCB-MM4) TaxID=1926491 RepID=UPI000B9B1329|nr:EAL domain-containing protein [Hahella sp. CCB-MM4]OZG71609.1 GGDEF domain-containing response regulator [Hahella sp. CCB-MM4]
MDEVVKEKLSSIRARYQAQLEQKAEQLELFWQQSKIPPTVAVGETALSELLHLLHRLAGSGRTFGFPDISSVALELDRSIRDMDITEYRSDPEALLPLKQKLLKCLAQPVEGDYGGADRHFRKDTEYLVYVVEDDPAMGEWFHQALHSHGYDVCMFRSLAEMRERFLKQRPRLVIMDVILPEDVSAELRVCEDMRLFNDANVPVVIVSSRSEFNTRLMAVRAGVRAYLTKPVNQTTMISCLHEIIEEQPSDPYRILLVDDDEDLINIYRLNLEEAGVKVYGLTEPQRTLEVLESFRPELVVLDLHMPVCSGLELGQVIRQQVRYANIPIVFLSADSSEDIQLEAIRLAGDDYINKPIEPWRLRTNLLARLKRARMVNQYVSELVKEISFKEQHDALTGLPNKMQLESRLKLAMRNVREGVRKHMALFLVDIDNFQQVNDAYGHELGDQLLVDMAKRLESSLPHSCIVSRPGGDEFAILFKSMTGPHQVVHYSERLLELCDLPFVVGADEVKLSFSIGVAPYSAHMRAIDSKTLFKQADTALFRAKGSGKNDYVIFESRMESELIARVTLASDLRKALQNDEFHLVFQPQVRLDNNDIVGAEVLIRWEHPRRGLVPPCEFIPVAESHGLIERLGEYVLRSSIRYLAKCLSSFSRAIPLAVNVSPRQFAAPEFVEQIAELLNEYDVDGGLLELEITESALAHDIDTAVNKLNRLRKLGVRVAVDDFGTGFSNMASLKRYPVDMIKIDRSFIRDLPHDEDDLAIVTAIIEMGHALGLKLLAEGVENEEQMQMMRERKCDLVQGFYISRPMPADAFESQYIENLHGSSKLTR